MLEMPIGKPGARTKLSIIHEFTVLTRTAALDDLIVDFL